MTKTFLRKPLITFSTAFMLGYGAISACGGWDYDWNYASNFTPEIFVEKSYMPLALSQDMFYYGYTIDNGTMFDRQNLSEWSEYLHGKMDSSSVKFFLLDSSQADVDGLQRFYDSKKSNPFSLKWENKIALDDRKTKDFITFLQYAKQIESASVHSDDWRYDTIYKTFDDTKILLSIESIYKKTQDKFLKNRYWFQTVKGYFYSNDKDAAIAFFDKTKSDVSKNLLYYRALSYVAGVYYQKGDFATANYLYSRVFGLCPELRIVAAYSFHPQEEKDWQRSLAMAKTADEKAALWAIYGYYHDEAKAIESIFKVKPDSPHLDFLLGRLVNSREMETEESYNPDDDGSESPSDADKTDFKKSIKIVATIADSKKATNQYMWDLAAGYMQTLDERYSEADRYFDKAEMKLPQNDWASYQLRILRLINNICKVKLIDNKHENMLLKELVWLYEEMPRKTGGEENHFRYQNAIEWSRRYLSKLYGEQGNQVMAELFVREPNFYYDKGQLQAMKVFLRKNNHTPFEQMALKLYDVSLADINFHQAVLATFQNKISEAMGFMEQSGPRKDDAFFGNPFLGNIKDCHDCDHERPQKRKYSNLEFLKTIEQMQAKIRNSEDVYTNSMLLGNAFYNITYFGNGRSFFESNIYNNGPDDRTQSDYSTPIFDCSLAKLYYTMARKAAKTDEQKAKCTYMLAKCDRNDYYNGDLSFPPNVWTSQAEEISFREWNGFKALKQQYSKTKYYREVLAECGYFQTYISQSKK
jgi:hypothetical protein